jgi:uncharacterized protein YndB with AHSA1/START domain
MKTEMTTIHSTFTLERTYAAAPERVFGAFADPVIKRRWFAEGENWQVEEYGSDFRVGGREHAAFRFKNGPICKNETVYFDIVPGRRIVSSYAMILDGKRISVSLATVVVEADGAGTRLTYTEQATFLEGADGPKMREEGCAQLLGALAKELGEAS